MLWYVAFGSGIGGALRYLLGGFVQQRVGSGFPLGTLAVNILGSLALGFLLRYALDTPTLSPETRALLTTGLCGGFTTFSAFAYETVALLEDGDWGRAAVYVGLSVLLSLVALAAGLALARLAVGWQARL